MDGTVSGTAGVDWAAARRRMIFDPTVTQLNTGSFGASPEVVFDRANEVRRRMAAGPTDFFVRQLPPLLWEARERAARREEDYRFASSRELFRAGLAVSE